MFMSITENLDYCLYYLDTFFKSKDYNVRKKYWFKEIQGQIIIYFKFRRRTDIVENFFIDYGFFIKAINSNKTKVGNNDFGCENSLNFFKQEKYRSGIHLDQEIELLNEDLKKLEDYISMESSPFLEKISDISFIKEQLPKENIWEAGNPYLEFNFDWLTHKKMIDYLSMPHSSSF